MKIPERIWLPLLAAAIVFIAVTPVEWFFLRWPWRLVFVLNPAEILLTALSEIWLD